MSLDVLIAEYPGDRAWERFVGVVADGSQDGALRLTDQGIARVLAAYMGAKARIWLDQPVPTLDGRTPIDVLSNHPNGATAIRSVLMRMPR